MKAPRIIYLQDGGDSTDEPLSDYEGVTWCVDKINDRDTKYIRADLHRAALKRARAERKPKKRAKIIATWNGK